VVSEWYGWIWFDIVQGLWLGGVEICADVEMRSECDLVYMKEGKGGGSRRDLYFGRREDSWTPSWW
jgi:hypothetical protein